MREEMIRKVDDLGRVVIPREIRKELGIKPMTPMKISLVGNTITLDVADMRNGILNELDLLRKTVDDAQDNLGAVGWYEINSAINNLQALVDIHYDDEKSKE